MKIGIMAGATDGPDSTIDGLVETAQAVEQAGFHQLWLANIFGLDAINALGIVGRETETIRLGTAVVPTYPRHPMAIAQQALTTQAASGGRFDLGIGLSHKIVIEDMFGYSYDKPARHMREYLQILAPLLEHKAVQFQGEQLKAAGQLQFDIEGPQLIVAALGPVMLGLAGKYSHGTITWMTGPNTLGDYTIPTLNAAAEANGRPTPRTVAGFPVVVTDDKDAAAEGVAKMLEIYGQLPSYRAMLDREGAAGPADVALIGTESELEPRVRQLADIGVTDLDAAIVPVAEGTRERSLEFLSRFL